MVEIQTAILCVMLRHLERWSDARRTHTLQLTSVPLAGASLELPAVGAEAVYEVFARSSRSLSPIGGRPSGAQSAAGAPGRVRLRRRYSLSGTGSLAVRLHVACAHTEHTSK